MGEGYSNLKYKYAAYINGKPVTDSSLTAYISNDVNIAQKLFDIGHIQCPSDIKQVIFNGPATIVIWHDGSKTVVKCAEGDEYSKFSGLAIAICKHIYGPNFKKVFNYFIPKEETGCHSSETTNSKQ